MALAAQTLVERALRLVDPEPSRDRLASLRTSLNALIPVALSRVVSNAMETEEGRKVFTRTFTTTATAGQADASAMLTAGLMPDALKRAEVYHGSSPYRFEWQPERTGVELMAEADYPVFTLEGTTLYFGDVDGETDTLSGTVTVVGVAMPTITNGQVDVPAGLDATRFESLMAEELAGLVSDRVDAEAA